MIANTGRIWEAASKEPSRPVLAHVFFDAEAKTLTATNSYIAARVPCEVEEGDESGLIPAAAVKAAAGKSLRVADGKATLKLPDGERSWPLLANSAFPDMDKVLKDAKPVEVPFGLNPRLLNDLGNALGAGDNHKPVVLHPFHPLKGMLVTDQRDSVGIIMPVRLSGSPSVNGAADAIPDITNDDAVIAGARAAIAALSRRRGKKKAAQAFRDALMAATENAS